MAAVEQSCLAENKAFLYHRFSKFGLHKLLRSTVEHTKRVEKCVFDVLIHNSGNFRNISMLHVSKWSPILTEEHEPYGFSSRDTYMTQHGALYMHVVEHF